MRTLVGAAEPEPRPRRTMADRLLRLRLPARPVDRRPDPPDELPRDDFDALAGGPRP